VADQDGLVARHGLVVAIGAASAAAWAALVVGDSGMIGAPICSSTWLSGAPTSMTLALAIDPPARIAAGWLLMTVAMMAPLTMAPLVHVRWRSFARRRGSSTLLFLAGYGFAWMLAGVALETVALGVRVAAPDSAAPVAGGMLAALGWQVSPAKQVCLNRCCRRPALAAFGSVAIRDAVSFGLAQGVWCVGGCWALMLIPLLAGQMQLPAMAVVAMLVFSERLDGPARPVWAWRGPRRLLRLFATWTRAGARRAAGQTASPASRT
jgi:predicted metal-binding membrane protein